VDGADDESVEKDLGDVLANASQADDEDNFDAIDDQIMDSDDDQNEIRNHHL